MFQGMKPRLESFLLGNTGPDVFFEIHRDVMQMLEDNYYPQFLQSEEFEKMRIKLITSDSTKSDIGKISSLSGDSNEENIESSNPKYEFYMDHSSYARNKIDQLQVFYFYSYRLALTHKIMISIYYRKKFVTNIKH